MKVTVGCPIYERGWVLNAWFDALDDWREHVDLRFLFVYTESEDDTLDIIEKRAGTHIVFPYNDGDHSTKRNWGDQSRLETMADMRNFLISQVNLDRPDFFLSLDSDVLVAPWEQSGELFDTTFDAVAPLVYLGPGDIGNTFHFQGDHHRRVNKARMYGVEQPVDVIAAAKLMTPLAYRNSVYGYDKYGEDFYWARQMKIAGIRLAFNSHVIFKHVMSPDKLDAIDLRVGW
jgi:hypothetical protein